MALGGLLIGSWLCLHLTEGRAMPLGRNRAHLCNSLTLVLRLSLSTKTRDLTYFGGAVWRLGPGQGDQSTVSKSKQHSNALSQATGSGSSLGDREAGEKLQNKTV